MAFSARSGGKYNPTSASGKYNPTASFKGLSYETSGWGQSHLRYDKALSYEDRKLLINMVQNAHYDVRHYPGHVATVESSDVRSTQRIRNVMRSKAPGKLKRKVQYTAAFTFVAGMLTVPRYIQEPAVCKTLSEMKKTYLVPLSEFWNESGVRASEDGAHLVSQMVNSQCRSELENSCRVDSLSHTISMKEIYLLTSPAWVAPLMHIVLSVVVWTAMHFGYNAPYLFVVKCLVTSYNHSFPIFRPLAYSVLQKPAMCHIRTPIDIWTRLMLPMYLAFYWLVSSGFLLTYLFCTRPEMRSWCILMALYLNSIYFKVVNMCLGANSDLMKIIDQELENTYVNHVDRSMALKVKDKLKGTAQGDSPTQVTTGGGRCDSFHGKSNIWGRLMSTDKGVLHMNFEELLLLLNYFERSHYIGLWDTQCVDSFDESSSHQVMGHETKTTIEKITWPINWHDGLCLTDSGSITEIFLDDYSVVLTLEKELCHEVTRGAVKKSATTQWESEGFYTQLESEGAQKIDGDIDLTIEHGDEDWENKMVRSLGDVIGRLKAMYEDAEKKEKEETAKSGPTEQSHVPLLPSGTCKN